MKKLAFALIGLLLLACAPVQAQQNVFTIPPARTSTNASSTISVTNTFQQVWPIALGRTGCTIQNNGTHTMYVYFGTLANATTGNSAVLAAGQALNCNVGGIILTDQVSITGTATDAFYANSQ